PDPENHRRGCRISGNSRPHVAYEFQTATRQEGCGRRACLSRSAIRHWNALSWRGWSVLCFKTPHLGRALERVWAEGDEAALRRYVNANPVRLVPGPLRKSHISPDSGSAKIGM